MGIQEDNLAMYQLSDLSNFVTGRAIHNRKAISSSEVTSDAAMNAVYGFLTRVERD